MSWPSASARTKNWGTEILTDADQEAQLDLLHTYNNDQLNPSTGHGHTGGTSDGPKITLTAGAGVQGILPVANGGTGVATTYTPLSTGMIIMWSGLLSAIPTGFVICNGSNGTPDLRGLMVVSTANATDPGSVSGAAYVGAHTHSQVAHQHQINANTTAGGRTYAETMAGGAGATSALTFSDGASTTGSYGSATFYALAYIMKT